MIDKRLLITHKEFLMRRNEQGQIKGIYDLWSKNMVLECSAKYKEVIFLEVSLVQDRYNFDYFEQLLDSWNIENLEIVYLHVTRFTHFAEKFFGFLHREKIRAEQPRNTSDLAYFNMHKYVTDPDVVAVYKNDHKKSGITLDKTKTFYDYEMIRQKNSLW